MVTRRFQSKISWYLLPVSSVGWSAVVDDSPFIDEVSGVGFCLLAQLARAADGSTGDRRPDLDGTYLAVAQQGQNGDEVARHADGDEGDQRRHGEVEQLLRVLLEQLHRLLRRRRQPLQPGQPGGRRRRRRRGVPRQRRRARLPVHGPVVPPITSPIKKHPLRSSRRIQHEQDGVEFRYESVESIEFHTPQRSKIERNGNAARIGAKVDQKSIGWIKKGAWHWRGRSERSEFQCRDDDDDDAATSRVAGHFHKNRNRVWRGRASRRRPTL